MGDYELVLVLRSNLGQGQKKLLEKVEDWVAKIKGKVETVKEWGKKPLVYPLKKETEGIFFEFNLVLPPNEVAPLEKKIRMEENILRSLLVKREGKSQAP